MEHWVVDEKKMEHWVESWRPRNLLCEVVYLIALYSRDALLRGLV